MSENKNTGKRKTAIILGIIGKDNAQEIYKHLTPEERQDISKEIFSLKVDSFDEVEEAVTDFVSIIKGNPSGMVESGMERVIEILEGIVSDEEREEIIENLYNEKRSIFSSLKSVTDINPLATMVSNEEPQFIALIATYLKPNMGADLLASLPSDKMTEVAEGVATMGQTNPEIIEQMEEKLSKKIKSFNFSEGSLETNGIKNIVSVLNNVPRTVEKKLFEEMDKRNPGLSEQIKQNLFVFEDLVMLDARSLQKAFAVITDNEMIGKALKTSSQEVKEKVISALPKQRVELLEEELETMGPIRREDSEEAQQQIANTIKELERKNEIVIDRGGGDVIL